MYNSPVATTHPGEYRYHNHHFLFAYLKLISLSAVCNSPTGRKYAILEYMQRRKPSRSKSSKQYAPAYKQTTKTLTGMKPKRTVRKRRAGY